MLDSFFGEGQSAFKVLFALIVVLGLLALAFWALRRFGGERLGNSAARGRQPRLAVIDAAMVDGRRRLILIRRDNVEHLLIIGGPTDVVIEQNIVRATGAPRDAPPIRAPADAAPRAVPLGEGSMWPLQPEPVPRPEPAPRPQRSAPMAEEPAQWSSDPEPPAPPTAPSRERARPRTSDPLAGLAQELGRAPAAPASPEAGSVEPPARQPEQPLRQPPRRTARPQPTPTPPVAPVPTAELSSATDQNLAEMAQRLEAALRRPAKSEDRPAQSAARTTDEPEELAPPARAATPPAALARPARSDGARPARAEAGTAPQKSLYDSLEQEMASLLGRPNEKT